MYALTAVKAAVYQIDKPFTYAIPDKLLSSVKVGMRVSVPFGQGNRTSEAVILKLTERPEDQSISYKYIANILDKTPILDENGLAIAAFMRERYFCTLYDAIRAVLPAGAFIASKETVCLKSEKLPETTSLPEDVSEVYSLLLSLGGKAEVPDMTSLLKRDITNELACLKQKNLISVDNALSAHYFDKTEKVIELAVSSEEAAEYAEQKLKRSPAKARVLDFMVSSERVSKKELVYYTGVGAEALKKLISDGVLRETDCEVFRNTYSASKSAAPLCLNEEQRIAFEGISEKLTSGKPSVSVLYGITGSGKTSVYIELIRRCLKMGRSALLLVPEIALTPQLVEKLTSYFGNEIAVLHSALSIGARYDEWKRIRSGLARVAVGTRSAVFAPLKDPGLLILDEEHDHSYKSENNPRFHAREVAIFRAYRDNIPVVLGSATPSVETMYRAETGSYSIYKLNTRYNGKTVPEAEIVDMKTELRAGNLMPVSEPLAEALRNNGNRQAILFLNRRGTSRMLVCTSCGATPDCPNCSAHLTYHGANNRLMCHYCGYSEAASPVCPECGGSRGQVGFGTQFVEESLHKLLPDAEILRMDADTVNVTNSHEKILKRFRDENIPVLVGTQMVTKGLDFPNVTIVGVLDADSTLYSNHFRASETAFSMITQVVGRSGRGEAEGRAYVQTYTPSHPVIRLAANQDYQSFYQMERNIRKIQELPPFRDLADVCFSGINAENTLNAAVYFREYLKELLRNSSYSMRLLGPAPEQVFKVAGRFRYRLTVGFVNTKESRAILSTAKTAFLKNRDNKGIGVYIDVNSYE